jgi:Fe-S-cluster containining protein
VPVTDCDLTRVVAGSALAAPQLIDWLGSDDIDMSGEPDSFVELNVGRRLMVLRHEGSGCRFLSSAGRCEIYEVRPAPCAAYPYSIEGRPGVAHLALLVDAPCSRDSAEARLAENGASDAAWRAVERVEEELSTYLEKVRYWNRQQHRRKLARRLPRNASAFLEYLGFSAN